MTQPALVGHITHSYLPRLGGTEYHIRELTRSLSEINHEVVTPKLPGLPEVERTAANCTITRVRPLDLSPEGPAREPVEVALAPIRVMCELLRLRNVADIVRSRAFDLLHFHSIGMGVALTRLSPFLSPQKLFSFLGRVGLSTPSIFTMHGIAADTRPHSALGRLERENLRRMKWVICVDRHIYTHVKAMREADAVDGSVWFVPNMIDTERFHPPQRRPTRPLVVGFAGRAGSDKGLEILAAVIAAAPRRVSFDVLLAESTSPRAQRFQAAVGANPHVRVFSSLTEPGVVRFYQGIDVLLQPIAHSGITRVSLEAMACGRPVIMLDNADRYPIVDDSMGFLVESGSASAGRIVALLEGLAENVPDVQARGAIAREAVCREFSVPVIAARMAAIYRTVLEAGPSARAVTGPSTTTRGTGPPSVLFGRSALGTALALVQGGRL